MYNPWQGMGGYTLPPAQPHNIYPQGMPPQMMGDPHMYQWYYGQWQPGPMMNQQPHYVGVMPSQQMPPLPEGDGTIKPAPPVEPPPPLPPDPPPEEEIIGAQKSGPGQLPNDQVTPLVSQVSGWQQRQPLPPSQTAQLPQQNKWQQWQQPPPPPAEEPPSQPPLPQPSQLQMSQPPLPDGGQVDMELKAEFDALLKEEAEFGIQYQQWRQQYLDWQEQNKNHPNKDQFDQYMSQWKLYEEQMEQRRHDIIERKSALELKMSSASKPPNPVVPKSDPGIMSHDIDSRQFPFGNGPQGPRGGTGPRPPTPGAPRPSGPGGQRAPGSNGPRMPGPGMDQQMAGRSSQFGQDMQVPVDGSQSRTGQGSDNSYPGSGPMQAGRQIPNDTPAGPHQPGSGPMQASRQFPTDTPAGPLQPGSGPMQANRQFPSDTVAGPHQQNSGPVQTGRQFPSDASVSPQQPGAGPVQPGRQFSGETSVGSHQPATGSMQPGRQFPNEGPSGPLQSGRQFPSDAQAGQGPHQQGPPSRQFPGDAPAGPGPAGRQFPNEAPAGPGPASRQFPGDAPAGPSPAGRQFPGDASAGPGSAGRQFPGDAPAGPSPASRQFPGDAPAGSTGRQFSGDIQTGQGNINRQFPNEVPTGPGPIGRQFPGDVPPGPSPTPHQQGSSSAGRQFPGEAPTGPGPIGRQFPSDAPAGQGPGSAGRQFPGDAPLGSGPHQQATGPASRQFSGDIPVGSGPHQQGPAPAGRQFPGDAPTGPSQQGSGPMQTGRKFQGDTRGGPLLPDPQGGFLPRGPDIGTSGHPRFPGPGPQGRHPGPPGQMDSMKQTGGRGTDLPEAGEDDMELDDSQAPEDGLQELRNVGPHLQGPAPPPRFPGPPGQRFNGPFGQQGPNFRAPGSQNFRGPGPQGFGRGGQGQNFSGSQNFEQNYQGAEEEEVFQEQEERDELGYQDTANDWQEHYQDFESGGPRGGFQGQRGRVLGRGGPDNFRGQAGRGMGPSNMEGFGGRGMGPSNMEGFGGRGMGPSNADGFRGRGMGPSGMDGFRGRGGPAFWGRGRRQGFNDIGQNFDGSNEEIYEDTEDYGAGYTDNVDEVGQYPEEEGLGFSGNQQGFGGPNQFQGPGRFPGGPRFMGRGGPRMRGSLPIRGQMSNRGSNNFGGPRGAWEEGPNRFNDEENQTEVEFQADQEDLYNEDSTHWEGEQGGMMEPEFTPSESDNFNNHFLPPGQPRGRGVQVDQFGRGRGLQGNRFSGPGGDNFSRPQLGGPRFEGPHAPGDMHEGPRFPGPQRGGLVEQRGRGQNFQGRPRGPLPLMSIGLNSQEIEKRLNKNNVTEEEDIQPLSGRNQVQRQFLPEEEEENALGEIPPFGYPDDSEGPYQRRPGFRQPSQHLGPPGSASKHLGPPGPLGSLGPGQRSGPPQHGGPSGPSSLNTGLLGSSPPGPALQHMGLPGSTASQDPVAHMRPTGPGKQLGLPGPGATNMGPSGPAGGRGDSHFDDAEAKISRSDNWFSGSERGCIQHEEVKREGLAQEELAGIPRIRRDSGANLSLKPEIDEDLRLEPEVIEDKDVPLRPPLHLPDWPRDVPPRDPYYDDPIHRAEFARRRPQFDSYDPYYARPGTEPYFDRFGYDPYFDKREPLERRFRAEPWLHDRDRLLLEPERVFVPAESIDYGHGQGSTRAITEDIRKATPQVIDYGHGTKGDDIKATTDRLYRSDLQGGGFPRERGSDRLDPSLLERSERRGFRNDFGRPRTDFRDGRNQPDYLEDRGHYDSLRTLEETRGKSDFREDRLDERRDDRFNRWDHSEFDEQREGMDRPNFYRDRRDMSERPDWPERGNRSMDRLDRMDRPERLPHRFDRLPERPDILLDRSERFDRPPDRFDRSSDRIERPLDRLDRSSDRFDRLPDRLLDHGERSDRNKTEHISEKDRRDNRGPADTVEPQVRSDRNRPDFAERHPKVDRPGRSDPGTDRSARDQPDARNRDAERGREAEPGSTHDRPAKEFPSPSSTPKTSEKFKIEKVEDLICSPGRLSRPSHLVVIVRGLPGSGKTYVSKLLREKEIGNGGNAPRMLCLDDYFMVEKEKKEVDSETGKKVTKKALEYEYEQDMEQVYRASLFKSFKKTIDDGFFPFIIVDAINETVKQFEEFWSYAKSKGFQVYVAEMEADIPTCINRNIHKWTEYDIEKIKGRWEPTPTHILRLDIRWLLQEDSITEVEMEDAPKVKEEGDKGEEKRKRDDEEEEEEEEAGVYKKSKWELDTSEVKLDKLDGLSHGMHKREPTTTMEDYLQLADDYFARKTTPGKKMVRWADLEEKKEQNRRRELGFVVGQTQQDWDRITDDNLAEKALNKTKYI